MLRSSFSLRRKLVSFKHRRMMDKTKAIIASIIVLVALIALVIIVTSKNEKQIQDVNQEDIVQKINITGDVLELKSDTFAQTLKGSEYVLVDFCKFRQLKFTYHQINPTKHFCRFPNVFSLP